MPKRSTTSLTDWPLYRTIVSMAGHTHTIVVTAEGHVLCVGQTDTGQCGIERSPVANRGFTNVVTFLPETAQQIIKARVSQYNTVMMDTSGTLYGMGLSFFGTLGFTTTGGSDPAAIVELSIADGVRVADFDVHSNAMLVLTTEGELFGWGQGLSGILTVPYDDEHKRWPVVVGTPLRIAIDGNPTVHAFAMHRQRVMAWTSAGMYTWGDNVAGSLGIGSLDHDHPFVTPMAVTLPFAKTPRSLSIALSSYYTVIITETGETAVCGRLPPWLPVDITGTHASFQRVEWLDLRAKERVVKVLASVEFVAILTNTGRVIIHGSIQGKPDQPITGALDIHMAFDDSMYVLLDAGTVPVSPPSLTWVPIVILIALVFLLLFIFLLVGIVCVTLYSTSLMALLSGLSFVLGRRSGKKGENQPLLNVAEPDATESTESTEPDLEAGLRLKCDEEPPAAPAIPRPIALPSMVPPTGRTLPHLPVGGPGGRVGRPLPQIRPVTLQPLSDKVEKK